jgi:hypothetical protein
MRRDLACKGKKPVLILLLVSSSFMIRRILCSFVSPRIWVIKMIIRGPAFIPCHHLLIMNSMIITYLQTCPSLSSHLSQRSHFKSFSYNWPSDEGCSCESFDCRKLCPLIILLVSHHFHNFSGSVMLKSGRETCAPVLNTPKTQIQLFSIRHHWVLSWIFHSHWIFQIMQLKSSLCRSQLHHRSLNYICRDSFHIFPPSGSKNKLEGITSEGVWFWGAYQLPMRSIRSKYSRVTPKRKAPRTENVRGRQEWMWHQPPLNEIEFCCIRNWQWENQRTRPKHLIEWARDSIVGLNGQ